MKDKSRLARHDDRQHIAVPSEFNSGCFEPSEDSFYGRYPRQQSDDDASMGRGFGAGSDAMMQRMMRRKQARQKRENAGLTTADSVAGYRGRDCSIEELIEYIDAKPPTVPKPAQKQTSGRKNRKKKRSSNRAAKSDNSEVKSVMPVSSSHECSGVSSGNVSLEKLAEETADVGSSTGAIDGPETCVSFADGEADSELQAELLQQHDTVSPVLRYEGSSSNTSDADNISDSHNDRMFGSDANCPVAGMEMLSCAVQSQRGCENHNLLVKVDAECCVTVTRNTEAIDSSNVNEFGTHVINTCCTPSSDSTVFIKETPNGRDCYKESNISETDVDPRRHREVTVANTEDCVLSISLRLSEDASVGSIDDIGDLCHYFEEVNKTSVHREIVNQPNQNPVSTQTVAGIDTGQSTPSSSISDARDSRDFDSQSLADEVLSDFDYCSIQASHESDFTVVTQKKKKNPTRQSVSNASSLQRTFYNKSHRDGPSVRDWQSLYRHETVKQLSAAWSTVPVTCSFPSSSAELPADSVSRHTSTSGEESEVVQSFAHDIQLGLDARYVSSAVCMDPSASNAVLNDTTDVSSCGENSNRFPPSAKQSTSESKTREKIFLDTRRPNVGVVPTSVTSELSFYYDVNIPEDQSAVQADSPLLSAAYSTQVPGRSTECELTGTSASSTTFPLPVATATSSLSPVTHTGDASSALFVDRCTEQTVSLQSSAGDNLLLLDNASQWQQCDVDIVSQVQSSASTDYVTLPSDVSSASIDSMNGSSQSGNVVVSHVVSTASQLSPSASASDSHRPSTSRRQRFDLRAAQLFLYNGTC